MLISLNLIMAANTFGCGLNAVLLNQDPYPAVPGESVKVIFQITGIENPACQNVNVAFQEKFPFTVDPESQKSIDISSGVYVKDYPSYLLYPVKLRIDEQALDGDNLADIQLTYFGGSVTKSFNVNVEDLRTDFEVSVKDYDPINKVITFEILNTGEHDVEALTIDIPTQDALKVKGSSRNIIGSLDSNDDTTFTFEGTPNDGEIKLILTYTDEINERRTLEKEVIFNSENFNGRGASTGRSIWFYIAIILIAFMVFRWWRGRRANKKRHMHQH